MPKRTANTPAANSTSDSDRMDAIESKLSQLQTKVTNLPASNSQNYDADIDQLQSQIDSLQTQLDDVLVQVDDTLAAWEETQAAETEAETVTSIITRWSVDVAFDEDYGSDITLDFSCKPTRIEEEDTYSIKVAVMNAGVSPKVIQDAILTVIFTPKTKDTFVDTDNTFLDSASSPYLDWESDFRPAPVSVPRISENCRRIEFISEEFNFTVPAAVVSDGVTTSGVYTLKLDFDLAYAK